MVRFRNGNCAFLSVDRKRTKGSINGCPKESTVEKFIWNTDFTQAQLDSFRPSSRTLNLCLLTYLATSLFAGNRQTSQSVVCHTH